MANVSSVVLNYAVRGADRAQRKDKQVRESVQRTGREARKQAGTIRRWMQRHQAAIAGIAAATAGAMMAIVRNSPTLRGELAGLRLAFSLFAMTVGEDVAPALNGLSDTALDLQEAYANLPSAIRKPISALIGFGLAAGFVVTALAGLETLIAGTAVASALGTIAAYASTAGAILSGVLGAALSYVTGLLSAAAAALAGVSAATAAVVAAIVAILAAIGVLAGELLGVTNMIDGVGRSSNRLVLALSNLLFFLLGPFIGALAVLYAFWKGGWDNAKRVALRFIDEIGKAFLRFATALGAGIHALGALIHTGFEIMWDLALNATKAGVNLLLGAAQGGINTMLSAVFHAREMVPAAFAAMWDAAKQHTANALNAIISKAEGAINSLIRAANKVPKINIDTVSMGSVDFDSGDPARHFEGAGRRARRAAEQRAVGFDRLDTEGVSSIRDRARSRLTGRLDRIRQRRDQLRERFAAEEITFAPESGQQQAPDSGPSPTQPQTQVEDNSVNIDEFRVEQQSTGDSELDGEQAGRAAMEYIEERQNQRQ